MISSWRLGGERIRSIAGVFVLASLGAACDQPLDLSVLAGEQSGSRGARQALEFDLPADYWTKDASGDFVITGFRLGFFSAGAAEPISTREVGREAIVAEGRTGQVFLMPQRFSKDVGPVVLRLQTLTRRGASEWSAPSPAMSETSGAAREPAAEKAGRGRAGLSMSEIERHPRLAEALRKVLPSTAKSEQVLASFRNVSQLAEAVALCSAQDIALDTLAAKMAGPPRQSLRNAVRELKPALRGTDALRKANAAAKELLAPAPKP